eukprot:gene2184-3351_t
MGTCASSEGARPRAGGAAAKRNGPSPAVPTKAATPEASACGDGGAAKHFTSNPLIVLDNEPETARGLHHQQKTCDRPPASARGPRAKKGSAQERVEQSYAYLNQPAPMEMWSDKTIRALGESHGGFAQSVSPAALALRVEPKIESLFIEQEAGPEVWSEWLQYRWPWAWQLAVPPNPQVATTDEYESFLKCYRILSPEELEAYESYAAGDKPAAQAALAQHHSATECTTNSNSNSKTNSPALNSHRSPSLHTDGLSLTRTHSLTSAYETSTMQSRMSYCSHRRSDIVSASVDVSDYTPVAHPKSYKDKVMLVRILRENKLFAHLIRESELEAVVDAMIPVEFRSKAVVFSAGVNPPPALAGLYVVRTGRIETHIPGIGIDQKGPGSLFGEWSVVNANARSPVTVTTASTVESFHLPNAVFAGVMGRQAHDKRNLYKSYLNDVPFLRNLSATQLLQLADALEEQRYNVGDPLIEFGKSGSYMHFIVEGQVSVWGRQVDKDGKLQPEKKKKICDFNAGHPVGYIEFFGDGKSRNIADVVANGAVITARLKRQTFEDVMGSVKEFLVELTNAPEYTYYRQVSQKKEAGSPGPAA